MSVRTAPSAAVCAPSPRRACASLGAERIGQEQGGFGGHGPAPLNDTVHDLDVDAHLPGQRGLAHCFRPEPLFLKHLPGRVGGGNR